MRGRGMRPAQGSKVVAADIRRVLIRIVPREGDCSQGRVALPVDEIDAHVSARRSGERDGELQEPWWRTLDDHRFHRTVSPVRRDQPAGDQFNLESISVGQRNRLFQPVHTHAVKWQLHGDELEWRIDHADADGSRSRRHVHHDAHAAGVR